jgi:radical SAM superfamily enzyme YgiQ (UPF0313 family)
MGQLSRSGRTGIARLSLPTVAALTPPGHTVAIHDARVSDPDYDADWDLVGFSAMTAEVSDAYRMADEFRKRGKTVVIGGYHATGLPEEAAEHADAVVVGEAETLWPRIIHELENGRLSRTIYRSDGYVAMDHMAIPSRHLLEQHRYSTFFTIQTTRGCPHGCDFCSVTRFFGRGFRHRPVPEVVEELKNMRADRMMILDDNITGNAAYAKELFKAMAPLGIEWGAQASVHLFRDPELMDLYARAGGRYVFIGFESTSPETLEKVHKGWNRPEHYAEGVRQLHRRGIAVLGSFIFGLDGDDITVFKRTVDFVNQAKIDATLYTILTPFPGTRLFERMKADGRIHDFDWSHYDACHSVIHPTGMTSAELEEGWRWANRETYTWRNIIRRVLRFDPGWKQRLALVYGYARKAYRHCPPPPRPERFADPRPDPPPPTPVGRPKVETAP